MILGLSIGGAVAVLIIVFLIAHTCRLETKISVLNRELNKNEAILKNVIEKATKAEERFQGDLGFSENRTIVKRMASLCNIDEENAWDAFIDENEFVEDINISPISTDAEIKKYYKTYAQALKAQENE